MELLTPEQAADIIGIAPPRLARSVLLRNWLGFTGRAYDAQKVCAFADGALVPDPRWVGCDPNSCPVSSSCGQVVCWIGAYDLRYGRATLLACPEQMTTVVEDYEREYCTPWGGSIEAWRLDVAYCIDGEAEVECGYVFSTAFALPEDDRPRGVLHVREPMARTVHLPGGARD